ncbi:ABC transporter ATP-binding protein [Nocardia yamanashiensis]|uniref:ABC transporter ATP-binding protein n=1 Tax=Nocardia yamanashiensis TaxID=209247 RepID=UPI001E559B94|nr:ABC transporter ATP-binding protein [Nocardia yamanashiensis]UGT41925.1 ABC transporter ATP-binding protein [Nocardia yamanashiensis]
MTGSQTAAIAVEDLVVVRDGRPVLQGLSFRVTPGSVTGLLGPSGCGKTTLIRSIVGVQQIKAGTVTVLGLPGGSAALRPKIGYVTQQPAVYADLTVRQNVRYFGAVYGVSAASVDRTLRDVGLDDRPDQLVDQLSGGQQARVSLACALVARPEVLVLDEPTVGLDPVLRRDLWDQFRGLAADGATLLVSSHVMDEAERCDRLLLMREGRLLADETPEELRAATGVPNLEEAFLQLVLAQERRLDPTTQGA